MVMSERLWIPFVFGLIVAACSGCAWTSAAQDENEVVAHVGDAVITLGDLEEMWNREDPRGRLRTMQDLYDTRRRVLDLLVGDRLIDREAEARGLGRDELLATELPCLLYTSDAADE